LGGYRDVHWRGYHDIPWQTVAYSIEKADRVQGHLLGLNLELRRGRCLAHDVFDGGFNLPNDVVLRSLGLNIHLIRQQLEKNRLEANIAARFIKLRSLHLPLKANRCIRNDWILAEDKKESYSKSSLVEQNLTLYGRPYIPIA
jgi:hypothetical protein